MLGKPNPLSNRALTWPMAQTTPFWKEVYREVAQHHLDATPSQGGGNTFPIDARARRDETGVEVVCVPVNVGHRLNPHALDLGYSSVERVRDIRSSADKMV